jgi:hypothetical protein
MRASKIVMALLVAIHRKTYIGRAGILLVANLRYISSTLSEITPSIEKNRRF